MAKSAFTEADVRRAVRGAMLAGLEIQAVEIFRDGMIRLLPSGGPAATLGKDEGSNTCDGIFGCDT